MNKDLHLRQYTFTYTKQSKMLHSKLSPKKLTQLSNSLMKVRRLCTFLLSSIQDDISLGTQVDAHLCRGGNIIIKLAMAYHNEGTVQYIIIWYIHSGNMQSIVTEEKSNSLFTTLFLVQYQKYQVMKILNIMITHLIYMRCSILECKFKLSWQYR